MSIEVKVPVLPESVADATIAAWHKNVGDHVSRDENLLDLETDKVVLEVPAPSDGVLSDIFFQAGDTVKASELLAKIDETAGKATSQDSDHKASAAKSEKTTSADTQPAQSESGVTTSQQDAAKGPAVRRMMTSHDLAVSDVKGTGRDGRLTRDDVLSLIEARRTQDTGSSVSPIAQAANAGVREERRVPMTRLRAKIAERLVQAQHQAAMLTTFNEVNLKAVMDMRTTYKDLFEKKHGVKLGLMSLFTKASAEALKRFPAVNASIDGQDIVYHGYYDIGIAVSTERGLVVPVLRDVDKMTIPEIEKAIQNYAVKARDGKLAIEDMQGGTFTITNGGVFGSLLATPIINPPQTGILGMHKIEERPIAEKGQVVIRPMMYVALSYDHRLIDGKESVQFLVTIKELLEDPARLLLNI